MEFRLLFFLIVTLCLSSCENLAIITTSKKQPVRSCNRLATLAEKNFWETLHRGDYDNLPKTTKLLTAAYLKNPNDPKLAAHLGFTHIWKITERARLKTVPPTITNEIILAKKYFHDAIQLNSKDPRTQGFLGDSMLVEGQIFNDEREQVHGYFQLQRAIQMWPEFNYFTAGYPMSTLDPNSDHFKEGLNWQWKTLDLCSGTRINRSNPNYRPFMYLETRQGRKRACWNSWIAPHNFEGFFLNMGDMLVKQGDWQTGVKIYRNAKLSKDYPTWPYRRLLEKRIADAQKNTYHFKKSGLALGPPDKTIIFNSGYGCAVCHQR